MTGKTLSERFSRVSIRSIIYLYFTISALTALVLMGISFYGRLVSQMTSVIQEENQTMLAQVNHSVDSYLRTIMKLSDSLYYDVIKNADLSDESIHSELNLLYDSSCDYVSNIALFSKDGELVDTVPAARIKTDLDVTKEEWFSDTLERTENLHFTMPHVQYIFDNDENQYTWVITLTRAVELTRGVSTEQGILLIDITYGSLKQLLDSITMGNHGYLYMISSGGQLIYHPQMQLIDAGQLEENIQAAVGHRDGNYRESYQGRIRDVTVKSVGYTGWKLVGVTPEQDSYLNTLKTKLFMVFLVGLFLLILMIINASISSRITVPIRELEKSVNALETGNLDAEVYQGGSYEIRHLGRSIGDMAKQIKVLMQDIVAEHESKRKSEFDTLQSQINPHFLYNTLDIIVWMIENEQKSEAVKVVTALARFFRISLSKGKSIITVRDELEHVRNYLMIQQMRFKNKFTYTIDAAPEVLGLASLKLMLQPLVENAIYHGMEFKDGDGIIAVTAVQKEDGLWFTIQDNGLGMTEEQVESLLTEHAHVSSKRGSGIGVKNVNERIRLYFGNEYGLSIESEPDEGTTIRIHLPAVDYREIQEKEEKEKAQ
ncbi:sensor histidine kinase [Clostridium sp. OF09-36]|mgnify:FL=1|uniref:sensor histidine kinase n=1 Tax=Clostridium sp. OF09-36 TaxID=2292310 RepID=UPI000E4CE384|nr:sensor histidine kinase [Clostridium sp. OF09-36]RHV88069.1 sensor histidine kinase [Clostridium sp. OF09-36]